MEPYKHYVVSSTFKTTMGSSLYKITGDTIFKSTKYMRYYNLQNAFTTGYKEIVDSYVMIYNITGNNIRIITDTLKVFYRGELLSNRKIDFDLLKELQYIQKHKTHIIDVTVNLNKITSSKRHTSEVLKRISLEIAMGIVEPFFIYYILRRLLNRTIIELYRFHNLEKKNADSLIKGLKYIIAELKARNINYNFNYFTDMSMTSKDMSSHRVMLP